MSSFMKSASLSAAVLTVLAAGAAAANAGVIWSDDFESLTPGQISGQANWLQDRGTDSDVTVVSDSLTAYQGSQFLSLNYSTGGSPRLYQTGFEGTAVNTADTYVLSMALRFTNTGHNGLGTNLNGDGGPPVAVNTFFNAAGDIFKVIGNTYTDLGVTIATDTWYNVTYVVKPATLDYQFTVQHASDAPILDIDLPYSSGTAITSWNDIVFTQDAGVGNAFQIDNMSFTDVPVPEPMTGSLLLIGGGLLVLRRRR
jgi:hypothetical protein